jgi:hypothetical protein
MNWDAIGAVGETLGAIAVIATLIYLASQIRQLKQQNAQATLQHIADSMNLFMDALASESNASLVVKGKESYKQLSEEEKLRFFAIYARFLNSVFAWYLQAHKTYSPAEIDETIHNLKENIKFFCDNPGFRELWLELREEFSFGIMELVDDSLN